MRPLIFLLWILWAGLAIGQDPTVPSKALLQRLKAEPPRVANQEAATVPAIKLKAIVLADKDHGNALVEVEGRRVILRLDRQSIARDKVQSAEIERPFIGLQLNGVAYHLEDFSERSIVLYDGKRRLFVQ